MPCSICKKQGHNKLTCPTSSPQSKPKAALLPTNRGKTDHRTMEEQIAEFEALVENQTAEIIAEIEANGFSVVPFERKPRWRYDEDPVMMAYYPAQYLAALQIFYKMFVIKDNKRAWIHLSAEMQAGKTGVMNTLIRLILANAELCQISNDSVFVITGMSDKSWVKQTIERVVYDVRENIKDSGNLKKIKPRLTLMSRRDEGLKNILIIIDESHIASRAANRPSKEIYAHVKRLCNGKFLENNIKFLTVSATDPASALATYKASAGVGSVRLLNDPRYLSVQKLKELGRIHKANDLAVENCMRNLYTFIKENPDLHDKYVIIRALPTKKNPERPSIIKEHIREIFGEFSPQITDWDSTAPRPDRPVTSDDDSTTSSKMEDINELLSLPPEGLHFIFVKAMFYAAKTMDTTNVGVLYDSGSSQKHDTALQSFLGRACGYNKNTNIYIFGNLEAVDTYIDIWRDIESKMFETPSGNIVIEDGDQYPLNGKMSGFGTKAIDGETAAKVDSNRAVPLMGVIDPETLQPIDGRMTVPIVLNFDEEFIANLKDADSKESRKSLLLEKLRTDPLMRRKIKGRTYNTLVDYEIVQFTCPESDGSYKRHIQDLVRKQEENEPGSIDLSDDITHERSKKKDNWQAFIDTRENRIVISIWHGTKTAL